MKRILILLIVIIPNIASAQMLDWHNVRTPTNNPSKVYGAYAAGCMDGGIKLPGSGAGYVLGAVKDNREYGQPEMINYISKLGEKVNSITGRTLIIGDIANARGGPAPINSSLHQSHQTGLDVDIWFRAAKESENARKIKQANMLDSTWTKINKQHWNETNVEILKTAASFDEVDRIFINSVIKKELCKDYQGEKWMQKIRPWWGHTSHFHVRLKCPEGNQDCKMQSPLPEGDGCGGELAWWFSDEPKSGKKEPRKYPQLPEECTRIFNWEALQGLAERH